MNNQQVTSTGSGTPYFTGDPHESIQDLIDEHIPFTEPRRSGFEPAEPSPYKICLNPEHFPPMNLYIPMGQQYRHVCPGCGQVSIMQAPMITCQAN